MVATIDTLSSAQRARLKQLPRAQRKEFLSKYLRTYDRYGVSNQDEWASLQTNNPDVFAQARADILRINQNAGGRIAAAKPDGGLFGSSGIGKILGAALPIAASFIPGIGPLGMALAGGVGGYAAGGDAKSAILGAVLSGGGKYILGGGKIPGLGNMSVNAPVSGIGPTQIPGSGFLGSLSGAANGLGSNLGSITKILGAVNDVSSMFGGEKHVIENNRIIPASAQAAEGTPFNPTRPAALATPASLSELSAYAPEQVRSNLATRGLNSGLGKEESDYYKNLLQRSLIGDGNKVNTDNPNFLMPIESSYFSGQGHNTSDIMQFLQSISA